MNFPFIRQVIVKQLSKLGEVSLETEITSTREPYHLGLIRHHGSGCRDNLGPGSLADAHSAVQQPPDHMNAIICQGIMLCAKPVDNTRYPPCHINRIDVHLDKLSELLRYGSGGHT